MTPHFVVNVKETFVKKSVISCGIVALAGLVMFSGGCNWSSGGGASAFNTSGGAGINVNFSGVYNGNYPDGKAVESSSGAAIVRMVLTQTGNSIEIVDNNGNQYKGSAGSPGLAFTPTAANPTIPAGAEVMQAQINFSGKDGSSGHQVQFVGIVHVVTIQDVTATSSSSGSGSTNATSTVTTQPTTTTETINDGTNTTTTTTQTIADPNNPNFSIQTVTVVVVNDQNGQTISKTSTQNSIQSQSTHTGQSVTQTYSITEANSQYRLEGQWLEKGGNTSGVDALSSAASGVISHPIN